MEQLPFWFQPPWGELEKLVEWQCISASELFSVGDVKIINVHEQNFSIIHAPLCEGIRDGKTAWWNSLDVWSFPARLPSGKLEKKFTAITWRFYE
jgi:hypothetical protein